MPAGPTILISLYLFIKPVLPQPHIWENILKFMDGVPVGHVEYIDVAVHALMGLVFFARLGRWLEVKFGAAEIDDQTQDDADAQSPTKDADA